MTQGFDFRWGVPLLDNQPGYAKVYEFMLDHYATVITRDEFLCIMHLARYHYNSIRGESRPSLDTIAKEMGYSHKNSVSRLVQSLEAKGMLKVTRRPGRTSIYNANPFTEHMLALAGITTQGVTPQCDGGVTPQCDGVSPPSVPEEEKDKEIKEEEEGDFLKQTGKSDRERIQDVLYDILRDGVPPPAPKQQRAFDEAVDTLVMEFKGLHGYTKKQPLDHNLTSKIIAAIRQAYEEKGNAYPFKGNRSPNTPIIDCIVDAGIEDKGKAAASSEWADAAERSQAALAERQALREEEQPDPFWQEVLGELRLQMTTPAFDTWLKPTKLLAQEEGAIVVGVANKYAKDWIESRLLGVIKRTLAERGVHTVWFEVMPVEQLGNGVLED